MPPRAQDFDFHWLGRAPTPMDTHPLPPGLLLGKSFGGGPYRGDFNEGKQPPTLVCPQGCLRSSEHMLMCVSEEVRALYRALLCFRRYHRTRIQHVSWDASLEFASGTHNCLFACCNCDVSLAHQCKAMIPRRPASVTRVGHPWILSMLRGAGVCHQRRDVLPQVVNTFCIMFWSGKFAVRVVSCPS